MLVCACLCVCIPVCVSVSWFTCRTVSAAGCMLYYANVATKKYGRPCFSSFKVLDWQTGVLFFFLSLSVSFERSEFLRCNDSSAQRITLHVYADVIIFLRKRSDNQNMYAFRGFFNKWRPPERNKYPKNTTKKSAENSTARSL